MVEEFQGPIMRRTLWVWWVLLASALVVLVREPLLAAAGPTDGLPPLEQLFRIQPLDAVVGLGVGVAVATVVTAGIGVVAWRGFGRRSDVSVVDDGGLPGYELEADGRPVLARKRLPTPRPGRVERLGHTTFLALLEGEDASPLTIWESPRFPVSLLVSVLGVDPARTVEFADPAFDDRFVVECRDERFARAVLDEDVREKLLELDAFGTLRVEEDVVTHRIANPRFGGGTFLDGGRLLAQARAVGSVAAAVDGNRSRGRSPGEGRTGFSRATHGRSDRMWRG